MPVFYKVYKLQRTFSDGRQDPANGKWYAKALSVGTVGIDQLADIIQKNCSMKKSDVKAVLTELSEVMADKLQESYSVKLEGLGTFKVGLKCKGAVERGEFSVSSNIVDKYVNFLPAFNVDVATGNRTKALLNGCRLSEAEEYSPEE